MGFDNKVTPGEMRRLFGWDFTSRTKRRAKNIFQDAKRVEYLHSAKAFVKGFLKPEDAKIEKESDRLAKWPAGKSGTAVLQGREIYFHEAAGFLCEYDRVFWQQIYDFPSVLGNPLIIDFKPGCGVSLRFWAEKFPAPRILIAQFEPEAHVALKKNIAVAGNAEVVFCEKASLITQEIPDPGEAVDFLNLPDWTGEQSCSEFFPEWLPRIEQLHFSCQHHPRTGPSLGKALQYLEEQGFEAFFQNSSSAKRPMFQWVETRPEKTMIDVWAKRVG
jgi:hypothetical protein